MRASEKVTPNHHLHFSFEITVNSTKTNFKTSASSEDGRTRTGFTFLHEAMKKLDEIKETTVLKTQGIRQ